MSCTCNRLTIDNTAGAAGGATTVTFPANPQVCPTCGTCPTCGMRLQWNWTQYPNNGGAVYPWKYVTVS